MSVVGARADFGAACFLAAAAGAVAGGRGEGSGAAAAGAAARAADGVVAGSGVMMLTGGVEFADGKSALVGLPVGIPPGGNAARGPGSDAVAAGAGAFHDPE